MKKTMLLVLVVLSSLMFALLLKCGPPVSRVVARPAFGPVSSGTASVVFVRPGRAGTGVNSAPVSVWDGEKPIGNVLGNQAFVVNLQPGYHRFVATADNTDVVEAELTAGKKYYVYLWYTSFLVGATVNVNPLPPDSKHWKDKDKWLERSKYVELIEENKSILIQRYLQRVKDGLAKFDPNGENSERRIEANYGI